MLPPLAVLIFFNFDINILFFIITIILFRNLYNITSCLIFSAVSTFFLLLSQSQHFPVFFPFSQSSFPSFFPLFTMFTWPIFCSFVTQSLQHCWDPFHYNTLQQFQNFSFSSLPQLLCNIRAFSTLFSVPITSGVLFFLLFLFVITNFFPSFATSIQQFYNHFLYNYSLLSAPILFIVSSLSFFYTSPIICSWKLRLCFSFLYRLPYFFSSPVSSYIALIPIQFFHSLLAHRCSSFSYSLYLPLALRFTRFLLHSYLFLV